MKFKPIIEINLFEKKNMVESGPLILTATSEKNYTRKLYREKVLKLL